MRDRLSSIIGHPISAHPPTQDRILIAYRIFMVIQPIRINKADSMYELSLDPMYRHYACDAWSPARHRGSGYN